MVTQQSDWNTYSPTYVEQKGKNAGIHKYRASKVLAERAAWKFMEDNKDMVKFDLTTILPPLVRVHSLRDATVRTNDPHYESGIRCM